MSQQPLGGSSPLLNVMARAVEKAARRLLRDFGEIENLQVSRKGPGNFVTNADRAAEDILKNELLKARPKFGFLMEESGEIRGEDINNTWIIDPLDGTTNFMHGLPHFAISVALQRQKEIIAAIVYDPTRDELFCAEKGKGAFVNNRRLRVSVRHDPDEALLASGLAVRDKTAFLTLLSQIQKVGPSVTSVRCLGATSLDMAYVAAGRLDGFWHVRYSPWDVAAGVLLVREAGGIVSDSSGGSEVLEGDSIIAGNEFIQPALCKVLGQVQVEINKKLG